jgi:hypothetical protein
MSGEAMLLKEMIGFPQFIDFRSPLRRCLEVNYA